MKTQFSIILVFTIILAVVLVVYCSYSFDKSGLNPSVSQDNSSGPSHTPFYPKVTPNTDITLSEYSINVPQGASFSLDVSVMSLLENETTTKSVAIQLLGYNNSAWFSGDPQRIFNASLYMNPVVLAPHESKSVNLTMNIAEDAPLGRYVFAVGNVQLIVVVLPKNS